MSDPIPPNKKQLESCEGWGWEHDGAGLFTKESQTEENLVGWFSDRGFIKMTEEEFFNE